MWASDRFVASCLAAAFSCALPAAAQPSSGVTDADIARAGRSQPTITEDDIDRARKQHRMPSDAELARVPIPSAPKLEALPSPAAPKVPDLEAIAKGYAALEGSNAGGPLIGPRLLVLVSFAMPEPTLARLVAQAARAKATLYLRGLVDGSLKETVLRAQRLIGSRPVAVQIDPRVFDRFAVSATPTFVLVRDGAWENDCPAGQCVAPDGFVAVSGDVSIEYALEFLARSAPSFANEAAFFLRRLKG